MVDWIAWTAILQLSLEPKCLSINAPRAKQDPLVSESRGGLSIT